MEKELGADVIKATQASLGKYVKRPPLNEKLLRKPPFRFLHDIVTSVYKTTGFFEGLFEENELISENVKDRDSKILFLNKVISVVGLTTGKSLTVKSSKIVAGQEADKTNELLQNLALALDKKLSSHEAVQKYKESATESLTTETKSKDKKDPTNKLIKKTNESKNLSSRSNEKLATNKIESGAVNKIGSKNNEPKIKNKESIVTKNDTKSKKSIKNAESDKKKPGTDLKQNQKVSNETDDEKPKEENKNKDEALMKDLLSKQVMQDAAKTKDIFNKNDDEGNAHGEKDRNSTADLLDVEIYGKSTNNTESIPNEICPDKVITKEDKGSPVKEIIPLPVKSVEPILTRNVSTDSDDRSNEFDKNKTIDKVINNLSRKNSEVRPPSVRPPSSRPGAPRLREKIDNVIPDTENLLLAKVNIIAENTNNEEDEDTSVIFVEQPSHGDRTQTQNQQDQLQLSSNEHGHLVQQILDSQKEFSQLGKTEIEWQFGAQKVKEAVNQEIEQLRFNIQALSRGANPLGKLLDHIQEDAEVMRQELQQWTNVYEEVSKEMQKEKIANEVTLFPLQSRIKLLDADIQEKHDKINDFKILIHKNVSRIEKLLLNGNVQ